MRSAKIYCAILVLILTSLLAGCGKGSSVFVGQPSSSANYINLQSDNGDYVGAGQSYSYSHQNAQISVSATSGHLTIGISGDEYWYGDFQVPNSVSKFQPGSYNNLQRYPFHDPAVGGLDWYGEGRGCNTLSGWFVVDKVTYVNDVLTEIDLRFEQHCEGATAALHGQIHWTSSDSSTPPGPVNPPPAGLWQPDSGSTPATGNYIYLQSDAGDYIGQGQIYTYTPSNATIGISASGGHLSASVGGTESWAGDFQTMNTISRLQIGYYGGLERYPFHNPVKGGLDWYGQGRGCNTLMGWFVVDNVSYVGSTLTAIDLRFEQHCEGFAVALHGQIHWTQ